ncbi:MAG: uridine kinase [Pseudomonadota bacterium]
MGKPLLIGIAGGSGSGKTTISRKVLERLTGVSAQLFQLDHYYRDLAHLEPAERDKVNFDHPDSLEMDLLAKHIEALADGKAIDRPTYEFASHTRSSKVARLEPTDVIIIDGIFALYSPEIRKHLACSVFVDVSDDVRFIRRLRRDVDERGRTNDGVIKQYLATVKPMHDQYVAPTKYQADLVVQWDNFNDRTIDMLTKMIHSSVAPVK